MGKTGRMIYAPKGLIDEMETIRRATNIQVKSDAFMEMVKYARVGRTFEKMAGFGTVPKYDPRLKRRKRIMEERLF